VVRVLQVSLQVVCGLEANEETVGVAAGARAEVLPDREVNDPWDGIFQAPERGDEVLDIFGRGVLSGRQEHEVVDHELSSPGRSQR
jgi:hypothetical protein